MAKYRKKPVVIDAFKWTGDNNQEDDPEWLIEALTKGHFSLKEGAARIVKSGQDVVMIICTLEGNHTAQLGDYIIRGVKGELYPCKPDIFEMTYEKVEEEE
jgi:hypothetical protein